MMKTLITFLISYSCFASGLGESSGVQGSDFICAVDESHPTITNIMCINKTNGERFDQEVEPIDLQATLSTLRQEGITILGEEDTGFSELLSLFAMSPNPSSTCFQRIYYTPQAFNAFGANSPNIARARIIAGTLKRAGVCDETVRRDNSNLGLRITDNDDLLQHFLCIANHESTFGLGKDNIGLGGRGPFGIHPTLHTQAGGICDDLTPIVRAGEPRAGNRNLSVAERTRLGRPYEALNIRRDNAMCAIRLYRQNGYTDWGTSRRSWGTNHSCSATERARFNFETKLGAAACCSDACRQRVARAQGRQSI